MQALGQVAGQGRAEEGTDENEAVVLGGVGGPEDDPSSSRDDGEVATKDQECGWYPDGKHDRATVVLADGEREEQCAEEGNAGEHCPLGNKLGRQDDVETKLSPINVLNGFKK